MSEEPSSFAALQLAGGASAESPDPELVALPAPPRRARTLTVLVLAFGAVAALLVALGLRREAAYALAGDRQASTVDLGDLRNASDMSLAENENRAVRAEAMLGAAGGIRYERPFVDDSFRALPVVGRASALDMWVEVRVPAGEESGRWQPPHSFSGRLVRLDASGPRHRGLRDAIEQATREHVPEGAWLLVDGEEPSDARWSIVLGAMFLGFAVWNIVAIARIVRKVRG